MVDPVTIALIAGTALASGAFASRGSKKRAKAEQRALAIRERQEAINRQLGLQSIGAQRAAQERAFPRQEERLAASQFERGLGTGRPRAARSRALQGLEALPATSLPAQQRQEELAFGQEQQRAALDRARTALVSGSDTQLALSRLQVETNEALRNLAVTQAFIQGGLTGGALAIQAAPGAPANLGGGLTGGVGQPASFTL